MNTRNTSLTIWLLSLFVSLAFTQTAQCSGVVTLDGRESSLLPQGKKFKLVWNDEFDGDRLDASKWSYRTNFWGRRAYWFATPEDNAVEVKDGLLHLKLVKKADGQFVSPQLQTGELVWDVPHEENPKGFWPLPKREKAKFAHRYGYYECRCAERNEVFVLTSHGIAPDAKGINMKTEWLERILATAKESGVAVIGFDEL